MHVEEYLPPIKDLKKLRINLLFEDIKNMRKKEYKNFIRNKCRQSVYEYLMSKRGSKGQEIIHTEIQTAEYLLGL